MRKLIWILMLIIFIIFSNITFGIEPQYVPLTNDSLVELLRGIIEAKLIPLTTTHEGLTINITKLNSLNMDWEQERLSLNVNFNADYDPGFFKVSASGQIGISGAGLISAPEQKIGVRLLEIQELKLDNADEMINEPLRKILDEILTGKEFWQGNPPTTKETLSKTNYLTLLSIAINKNLPITGNNQKASITLTQLDTLKQVATPGQFEAVFTMKGKYKTLTTMSFEGKMGLMVSVSVNPPELTGKSRIDSLTSLDLKNVPSFLDSVIRSIVNSKIKGTTTTFAWK